MPQTFSEPEFETNILQALRFAKRGECHKFQEKLRDVIEPLYLSVYQRIGKRDEELDALHDIFSSSEQISDFFQSFQLQQAVTYYFKGIVINKVKAKNRRERWV